MSSSRPARRLRPSSTSSPEKLDRDPRTVRRWLNEPDGLPYTKLGNRILIHIPTDGRGLLGACASRIPPQKL